MKSFFRTLFALFMGVFIVSAAGAAFAGPVNKKDGLAVKGYDVVAYFSLQPGEPAVKGDPNFISEHDNAMYQFMDNANKLAFEEEPERYLPQYGGYCAYAVTQNNKVDIDPNAWAIVDGKLYLNYSPTVQGIWNKDIPGYIATADKNWPALKDKD